jgi:hypothetical protein
MEKDRHLDRIFALTVIFVVGYYLVNTFLSPPRPPVAEKQDNRLLDAKTGQPIPDEEISRITERQEKARRTYVLTGKVIEKSENFLRIEVSGNEQDEKWVLRLLFAPKMVFLKETPLQGFENDSSATEEREISLMEVSTGDIVSAVFPKGVIVSDLKKSGVAEVGNLTVNLPRDSALSGE